MTRLRNLAVAIALLGGIACAGCSSQPVRTTPPSVQSCVNFGISALDHHVTVRTLPPACQGLSRAQVNYAVGTAIRSVAGRVPGKSRQRARAASLAPLLADLVKQVPPSHAPPVAAPVARPLSQGTLRVLALCAWLLTVGLGSWMLSRWFSRRVFSGRRSGPGQADSLSPFVNLGHLGLAVSGLLAWIAYMASGLTAVGWVSCALLLPTAGIGMSLVFLGPGRRRSAFVVAGHITLAAATMLLALLAVVGAG